MPPAPAPKPSGPGALAPRALGLHRHLGLRGRFAAQPVPRVALLGGKPAFRAADRATQPRRSSATSPSRPLSLRCSSPCFRSPPLLLEERGRLRLPLVCSVGFFAVAVGFVTFPYHLPGGAPIGIAEAGRVIILVFIIMALLRYYQGCPPQAWLIPLARLACLCALAMAVADVLVMTLYLNPALDLFDFTNRTIFGGVGVLVLVALLLGPMPHVYEVVRRGACHSEAAGNNAENTDEGARKRGGGFPFNARSWPKRTWTPSPAPTASRPASGRS